MKKIVLGIVCFLTFIQLPAQTNVFAAYEDSLIQYNQLLLSQENDTLKITINTAFCSLLLRTLSLKNSFNYPFDSIQTFAILSSSDKSFRIFNWEVPFSDGTIRYYGMVQTRNAKKHTDKVVQLTDHSELLKKPENMQVDPSNWYGAHYYKLIETKYRNKTYYTLLGANWSNLLVRKKLIELIQVGEDGKIKFGADVFHFKNRTTKRAVFSYSSEISMSLRYDETRKMILFDHLAPRSPDLTGQYEFYSPDLSIDGFIFKKGKWNLVEDIDARNEKRK